MARQLLARTTSPGPWPVDTQLVTMTAEDVANHSAFNLTGRELLLVQNSHATTTYTVTIYSVADSQARTKDIGPKSLLAGEIHVVGPFSTNQGWAQTGSLVNVDANNAAVKLGVIVLPN